MTAQADLRGTLAAQREAAAEQIAALTGDLDGIFAAADSGVTDDEHDPEGVTVAVERAQVSGLIAAARTRIADIDAALARIDAGSYGRCEGCGGPISAARLVARPSAALCIDCAIRS